MKETVENDGKRRRFAPRMYAIVACGSLAMCGIGGTQQACTPGQREGAKTAIDAAKYACIVSRIVLADSVIAEQCGVFGPALDEMRSILGTTRTAMAAERAAGRAQALEETVGRCPPTSARADAGAGR